jgi:hypothetical protein
LPSLARRATIGPANGDGDELAGLEVDNSWANGFDFAEHLVSEHKRRLTSWGGTKGAVDELAVCATDPDLSHAHQDFTGARLFSWNLREVEAIGLAGMDGDPGLDSGCCHSCCCSHGTSSSES